MLSCGVARGTETLPMRTIMLEGGLTLSWLAMVDLTSDRVRNVVEVEAEGGGVVVEESTLSCSKVTLSRSESVKWERMSERRFADMVFYL